MKNFRHKIIVGFLCISFLHFPIYSQFREKDRERRKETKRLKEEHRERFNKLTLPHYEDYKRYKEFWRKQGYGEHWYKKGMFRLFPAGDCEKKYVIKVNDPCVDFIPVLTSYNFRSTEYSGGKAIDDYDIKFIGEKIISHGFFTQGIFVPLGKIDIRNVSLATSGMKFLNNFQPASNLRIAHKQFKQFANKLEVDGFTYSNQVLPSEGMTYGLRVIPYRIKIRKKGFKEKTIAKIVDTDKRKLYHQFLHIKKTQRLLLRVDTIFVFKIIRKSSEDKGLTIVWKRLLKRESPHIYFAKNERLMDFK